MADLECYRHNVSGDVTAETVFIGKKILKEIKIWKDVDGGTFDITDIDGVAELPQGVTDYVGSHPMPNNVIFENGMKITTTNFTGGTMIIFYYDYSEFILRR